MPREVTLRVTGMTCEDCAYTIKRAISALPGVQASVSYGSGTARVEGMGATTDGALLDAVRSAGYGAEIVPDGGAHPERSGAGLHIAIVGSGAGAFASAIRAAELGARVTIVERGTIGGTCVNTGCVPSKVLLHGAHLVRQRSSPAVEGLGDCGAPIDRPRMRAQQQDLVKGLRYAKYGRIVETNERLSLLEGTARFADSSTLIVTDGAGTERRLAADRFLIATGSSPSAPPIPGLSETPYWTSEDALASDAVPEHLLVLGGSAIGLEIGQAYSHLGARVTLIEREPRLLPREDAAVGEEIEAILSGEGMRVLSGADVERVSHDGRSFTVDVGGEAVAADRMLVATGRAPNTSELNLAKAGVKVEADGAVRVDDHMRTSTPGVYAAGDCTTQPQLVYVAAAAGTRAAVNMTGGDAALDLSVVPSVVFTEPQIAVVGLGEESARAQGLEVRSRTLRMEDVPRALAIFDTRGFVKLVVAADGGRLLGVQAVAPAAGEIIQTAALAIAQRMTFTDLADRLFPYLTMAESLKLCAQTFTHDVKALSCCAG